VKLLLIVFRNVEVVESERLEAVHSIIGVTFTGSLRVAYVGKKLSIVDGEDVT
jgi:hypothetical protein